MAKSKLEYWTGSAWTEAKTIENQNALIRVELEDTLDNAMKANITLGNAAYEPFREGLAAHADRYGPLTSVFTDFIPIRIIETDSNVVLFHGKVYDIKNIYDKQRGQVVNLYARDHLAELADYPTDDKDAEIKVGTGTSPSILNRSQLIKHIIRDTNTDPQRSSLQLSADNIAFDDALKFTASGRLFSTDLETDHTDSYKINTLGRQGLKAIYEIAKNDPHETSGDITDYGYDFYGDSQFTLASATNPALDFNYFKRGTRPPFESTPAAFKGLTVEFPIAKEFSETGNTVLMLPAYDFNLPKRDLYTGATAAISRNTVLNAGTDDEEKIATNFNLEFEILEVSDISAAFTWKNKLLNKWNTAALDAEIAEELKIQGTSTVVGRIQYQSITSGNGTPSTGKPAYILISFEPDYGSNNNIITQKKNFNALSGTVTLVGVQSSRTLIYNSGSRTVDDDSGGESGLVQGRPSASFGLTRPLRISASDSKHVDSMRRRIASALARSKTTRTECTVRIIPPPFIYVDTTVASVNSGVPRLVLDAEAYGFRTGMTIAKIDSTGEQTAYGYATIVNGVDVAAPLNTGAWTNYTGSVRLYLPVRAGHYIYAKNLLTNFTGYMFVKSAVYTEEPGAQATQYKGTGVNTAGSAIGLGIEAQSIQATIEGEGNKYPRDVNIPVGGLGYTYEKIDNTRNARFTMVDYNTISWTGGLMVIGGGGLSYEVVAGSVNLSSTIDSKTKLPVAYKLVFTDPDAQTPDSSGRYVFSFILVSAYKPDHDNIVMGHARASKNTTASGRALLLFDGSGLGLFGGIDAAGEDQFTASLFKKSIQPYTTDVEIKVGNAAASFANKNRYVSSTAGTLNFADNNTVSVAANTTLDLWNYPIGNIGIHADNDNKTWYIFYRLMNTDANPDEETNDFTLVNTAIVDRTLVYGDATSDSRGLLAICGTGDTVATGNNLEEIAIQAFHGKGQNITADTIAANSIVANAIKTGVVTTSHIDANNPITGNKLTISANVTFDAGWRGGSVGTGSGEANSVFAQSTAPTSGVENGDLWIDTDDQKIYTRVSGSWVLQNDAKTTAIFKSYIYAQNNPPINQSLRLYGGYRHDEGNLWSDTNNKNNIYRLQQKALIDMAGNLGGTSSDTSIVIDGTTAFLIVVGDVIFIEDEDILVGTVAVDTPNAGETTLTVTRAVSSSTISTHSNNEPVFGWADIRDTDIVLGLQGYNNALTKGKMFSNAKAVPPTTTNSGGTNLPNFVVEQYDSWLTSDTNQFYIALHATSNTVIASGQWTLKDDADAINRATTTISGGLINTQRIKLLKGGGLTGTVATNVMQNEAGTKRTPVSTLRLINEGSGINSSVETFNIDAFVTNDLRIYAGDIIQIDDEDMRVKEGSSDTTLKVERGYNSTNNVGHDDDDLISKYMAGLVGETTAQIEANHIAGLTDEHIILDNSGITGYSDEYTQEFSISAETGKGIFGGGTIVMDASGLTMTSGGFIRSGKANFSDNANGFFLGYDGTSSYDFAVGGSTNSLKWDGSAGTLEIKGSLTIGATNDTLTRNNTMNDFSSLALARVGTFSEAKSTTGGPVNQTVKLVNGERKDVGNIWFDTADDNRLYRLEKVAEVNDDGTGLAAGETSLTYDTGTTATSFVVGDRLYIEQEDMKVTGAASGTTGTVTVSRQQGTAAPHNADVEHLNNTHIYKWVDVGTPAIPDIPAASIETTVFAGSAVGSAAINTDTANEVVGDVYVSSGDDNVYTCTAVNSGTGTWALASEAGTVAANAAGAIGDLADDSAEAVAAAANKSKFWTRTAAQLTTGGTTNPNGVPVSTGAGDILWVSDTSRLYIANNSGQGDSATVVPNSVWIDRNDAAAINSATTKIKGGLITTERINLYKGGAGVAPSPFGLTSSLVDRTSDDTSVMWEDTGVDLDGVAAVAGSDPEETIDVTELTSTILIGDIIKIYGRAELMYVTKVTDSLSGQDTIDVIRNWPDVNGNYTFGSSHPNLTSIYRAKRARIPAISTPRIVMDYAGITGYGSSNALEFRFDSQTGKGVFGGGAVTAGAGGLQIGNDGGSSSGMLNFDSGATGLAFIQRYWTASAGGRVAGTLLISSPQDLVLASTYVYGGNHLGSWFDPTSTTTPSHSSAWQSVTTQKMNFQCTDINYAEYATISAPPTYSSGNNTTARYTIMLPKLTPGGANKILKSSGSTPYSQLVWVDVPSDGDDGDDGATWTSSTYEMSSGAGNNGDFHFQTTTDKIFKKTSGTWGLIATITGAPGEDGDHVHNNNTSYTFNNVTMAAALIHDGDSNTKLIFADDNPYFRAGNIIVLDMMTDRTAILGAPEVGFALKVHGETSKTSAGFAWDDYSDDRIKTDVASITNATDTLKTLNPVSFKYTAAWREANPVLADITEHGFLASDFEGTFPNKVRTGTLDLIQLTDDSYQAGDFVTEDTAKDEDKMPEGATKIVENIKTINESLLLSYLVAAIKELEARIAALEA